MKARSFPRALVAAALLALASALAHAQPYVHAQSQIAFPDEIAGVPRRGVQDYEAQQPGLGVSVRYELMRELRADVYVYTGGLKKVPAELTDPAIVQRRRQTDQEIITYAKTQGADIRKTASATQHVQTSRGLVPVFYDAYEGAYPSGPIVSYVWLWPARNHLVKIRISHPATASDPTTVRDFVEAVVRLTDE